MGWPHPSPDRHGYAELDEFDCFAIQEGETVYRSGCCCGVTSISHLFFLSIILVNFLYLLRYPTNKSSLAESDASPMTMKISSRTALGHVKYIFAPIALEPKLKSKLQVKARSPLIGSLLLHVFLPGKMCSCAFLRILFMPAPFLPIDCVSRDLYVR